jgi:putative ABC transport system permease protein
MRHHPGLSIVAIMALALGIGATTSMFSIVHGGLRPLPFAEPHEIVALTQTAPRAGGTASDLGLQFDDFRRWSEGLTTLEAAGGFEASAVNVSGDSINPARADAAAVTANMFPMTGVVAAAGRTLLPADEQPGAPPVVVVSDRLWRARYGSDPTLVGRTIHVNDQPRTVVGIMPPGFGFPIRAALWLPLQDAAAISGLDSRDIHVFGRLRDGRTARDAETELNLVLAQQAAASPSTHANRQGFVLPFTELETPRETRLILNVLLGAVSLILLVACANVANLLLARAVVRSRESAIRSALGATRVQLVGRFLAESAAYAGIASVIGLGIAALAVRFFAAASAEVLDAFWIGFHIDWTVVAAASLLGLVATIAAGLGPALRASRADVTTLLREASERSGTPRLGRMSQALVIGQVALACAFLCVTATFVRAAVALRAVEFPIDTTRVLTAQLAYRPDQLDDPIARVQELHALRDAINASPGVRASAFTSVYPGRGAERWTITFPDRTDATPRLTQMMTVSPDFFAVMNAAAVRGRLFDWSDDGRREIVAVVNESFVRQHSADRDPLGRPFSFGRTTATIVGVVPDLQMQDVEDLDGAGFYVSIAQRRPFAFRLMVAGPESPLQLTPAIRRAIAGVNPGVPIEEVMSLHDAIYRDKQILDALAVLFLVFGLGAIFLAMVGLHGVLAFVVASRSREFGVRVALGAEPRDLVRLVMRTGGPSVAIGLGLGLVMALGLSLALASAIERLPAAGFSLYAALALVVLAGSAAALAWPIRRVIRLDVADVLRF